MDISVMPSQDDQLNNVEVQPIHLNPSIHVQPIHRMNFIPTIHI